MLRLIDWVEIIMSSAWYRLCEMSVLWTRDRLFVAPPPELEPKTDDIWMKFTNTRYHFKINVLGKRREGLSLQTILNGKHLNTPSEYFTCHHPIFLGAFKWILSKVDLFSHPSYNYLIVFWLTPRQPPAHSSTGRVKIEGGRQFRLRRVTITINLVSRPRHLVD